MLLFVLLGGRKRPFFAFGLKLFKPGPILPAVEFFVIGAGTLTPLVSPQ